MSAGRELDAMVAEKVMGWTMAPDGCWVIVTHNDPDDGLGPRQADETWSPSRDISAAWDVFERLSDRLPCIMLNQPNDNHPREWCVEWFDGEQTLDIVTADTAPLAICLAALKALGDDA